MNLREASTVTCSATDRAARPSWMLQPLSVAEPDRRPRFREPGVLAQQEAAVEA